ncbi:hypothetical protein N7E81_15510 [Reichenbachiella carrageenanivorans]|uniref:Lipocalin-like domain-containing protein n=1 Tax=Reichenbachiella carrageenanivorans TaxID=2979869 RepID=A0ABY6CZG0_9BACT|nr:hypothetical protein [Reichenbachiella carrageenanivorans]UXX78765.1 hypothetical protein N7E81_15510 [Reichenbachiella carrageenanivorans]
MKLKSILSILALSALIYSCGDDDNNDPFDGVPSSEIVDVELREATLTGSSESSSSRELAVGDQKWWKQKISKVQYSGECGGAEDQELTDGYYYGFYPSGEYYAKSGKDGTPVRAGSWQWVDGDKDAIYISSVTFTLRGLNDDELIIASDQSQGPCSAITWEQFNQPYIEE